MSSHLAPPFLLAIACLTCGAKEAKPRPAGPATPAVKVDPPAPRPSAPLPTPWRALPGRHDIRDIGPLRDDGAFIAGGVEQRWLLELGADGSQKLLELGAGKLYAAVGTASGELLLAGATASDEPWFGRVDARGVLAAQAVYEPEVSGEWQDIVPHREGALLVGTHNPLASGVSHGWALFVGRDGEVIHDHRLGEGSYHYFNLGLSLPDGGALAFGAKKRGTYSPWLVRIDSAGAVAAEQLRASDRWGGLDIATRTADGSVYTASVSAEQQARTRPQGRVEVLKADSEGVALWSHLWLDKVVHVGSMTPLPEGGAMFLAATRTSPGSEFADAEGDLLLVRVPPDGGEPSVSVIEGEVVMLDFQLLAGMIVCLRGQEVVLLQLRRQAGSEDEYEWRFSAVPR